MFRISKEFRFEAAHWLPDLPEGHQCGRVHGHSYTVRILLAAEVLRRPGFVADFADLSLVKAYIDSTLDHRFLNEVLDVAPTSELLARHFYHWCTANLVLPGGVWVESVRVSETPTTYAEYLPASGGGDG
ncbi:6-carboxytetrahydropterin synthase QueD [Solwaraspora sp. WMMD1047]|uniref:6-carboxytetrahydropterin synthase QueD n=1 Tax=Solwaraspora sp. WMMD1047 TaxID=3016102 RepID=UPI002416D353|nr:6-carboxytetrahydropterin synthase QueD [Solwaraspora sp. WMMD1047]MDG4830005.1 6-carboxytetrahydropterin synthase QueD [Solwaraspora sp. WMMD1047]